MADLTPKQQAFVEQYLVDLNATQAAIRAGYSPKTAHSAGPRLLENVDVQRALQAGQQARAERTQITADYVLSRIQTVAERCLQEITPVTEKVDGETVETGEFTFNAAGANKALELLGKHLGIFTDKVELKTRFVARMPEPAADVETWLQQSRPSR